MTDAQLRDQAVTLLAKTTATYPAWVKAGKPTTSYWAKALGVLAQIGATPPAPPPPATSHLALIHEGGGLASYATKIGSYECVVVTGDDATNLNPKTLMYANAAEVRNDGGSGVSFARAESFGYLTGVVDPQYPATFADIKQPAFRTWFASQMVSWAKTQGAAGIFLDSVSVTTPVPLPGYTNAQYQGYMALLVKEVGAALKADELYLMVNAAAYISGVQGGGDASADIAWAQQLAPFVGGIMSESFMTTRDGANTPRISGPAWNQEADSWYSMPAAVEAAGADFCGLTYGPMSNALYGYATVLTTCGRPGSVFMWGAATDPVELVGLYTGTASVNLAAGTGVVS